MKKLVSLLFVLFVCAMSYGQDKPEVTRFLGIPVDGTKAEMMSKLKEKGFSKVYGMDDMLEGEFNGKDSYVSIHTNNRKVWRICVVYKNGVDETQIKLHYNNLYHQFEENSKYIWVDGQIIPESEDISYEMTVNNKPYQICFSQISQSGDYTIDGVSNRLVWFTIIKDSFNYGEYRIAIYYENGYNKANGEDL